MGRGFAAGLALLFAALPMGAAHAVEACTPVDGSAAILARPDLHWLVVGESHGTAEMPAAFGDLVCLAAASARRPIVVGLEFQPEEQPRLDAYMATSGDEAARTALLAGPVWQSPMPDGRGSAAMLALVERLRVMKQDGRIARVVAFRNPPPPPSPDGRFDQNASERAIAQGMKAAGPDDALVLIFTGNLHAAQRAFARRTYAPAAADLPSERTLTLNMAAHGGSQWSCTMSAGKASAPECGPHDWPPFEGAAPPRGIVLEAEGSDAPWGGRFELGGPVTASPPAVSRP